MRHALLPLALCLAACGAGGEAANEAAPANRVVTSGKTAVPLAEVPPEVLAAAQAARPGFTPAEAEAETRDGRLYFDVGGTLGDGSEVEFDIMEEGGSWRVVETQRDVAFAAVPAPVRAAALAREPGLQPTRVIESVQADGLTIYELYAGPDRKLEVKWDGKSAELLTEEWAH